jgi:hypothetical protein
MDVDDISLPERLKLQYEYMESNSDVGIHGSWVEVFGLGKNFIWQMPTTNGEIRTQLFFESAIAHPSAIIRKKVLDKYGLRYDGNSNTLKITNFGLTYLILLNLALWFEKHEFAK